MMDAQMSGYTSASEAVSVTSGSTAEVTITLQAVLTTGDLRVTVKDSSGSVVSGVSVSSTSQPTGQAALSGTTGVDGTVVFNDVLPGSYVMQGSKSGTRLLL